MGQRLLPKNPQRQDPANALSRRSTNKKPGDEALVSPPSYPNLRHASDLPEVGASALSLFAKSLQIH
jgi:hypothetical protein